MADDLQNPFAPSKLQTLGMMLSGLGSGISAASARNLPAYYGIAPGAQAFTNSYNNLLTRGANYDLANRRLGIEQQNADLNKSYRDTQQKLLEQQIGMAKRKQDALDQLVQTLPGFRAPQGPQMGPAFRDGISGMESGGNYGAVGPVATPQGNRAYGKYQVLDSNIGPWTQEVLGKAMTPQEFLANPQAQDKVFDAKFGQYVQKYGPQGAARAWFAGEGGMNNPNASDVNGTTVSGYGQRFAQASGMPQLPGPPPDTTGVQVLSSVAGVPAIGQAYANRANALYGYDKFRYQAGVDQQKLQQAINNGDVIPGPNGTWVPNPAKTSAAAAQETAKKQVDLPFDTASQLIKGRVEDYDKNIRPKALDAVADIDTINQMRQLLDQGVFSGPGTGIEEYASRLSQIFPGVSFGADQQANTKAFQGYVVQRLMHMIKAFGSGTGISDADVRTAQTGAAGNLEVGEASIRKLLALGERADRNLIKRHSQEAARLKGLKGADALGPTYFDLPAAPSYEEWKKENPPIPTQGAPTPTPQRQTQAAPGTVLGHTKDGREVYVGADGKQYVR